MTGRRSVAWYRSPMVVGALATLCALVITGTAVGFAASLGVESQMLTTYSTAAAPPSPPPPPSDTTAPALTTLEMFDADTDGTVDRVVATFDETLAAYSASTTPWTLTNVPSGGSLVSVTVTGQKATLTLNEGAGAPNTAVGSFTVTLAQNANGIRDAAGNRSSFAATAPADKASPRAVTLTDTDGSTDGRIQAGDTLTVTFTEAITGFPATTTVSLIDPPGGSTDILEIVDITDGGLGLGDDGYVTSNNRSASFASSTTALSNANRTLTLTVGGSCQAGPQGNNGCANLGSGGPGAFVFEPSSALMDAAGNTAVGSVTKSDYRIF